MKKLSKTEWLLIALMVIQTALMILRSVGIITWAWWIVALPVTVSVTALMVLLVVAVIIVCMVGDPEE